MKKFIGIIFCLIVYCINIYSFQENYITIGTGYKQIFCINGDTEPLGNHKGMFSLNLHTYGFWDSIPVGLFASGGIALPLYISKGNNDSGIYYGTFQDVILGTSFKYSLGERFTLLTGLGVAFNVDIFNVYLNSIDNHYKRHAVSILNLGIGGEVGLKFNINSKKHLFFGLTTTYTFANYTDVIESYRNKPSGWTLESSIIGNVFIGIGFNKF